MSDGFINFLMLAGAAIWIAICVYSHIFVWPG
jgi:hypothetical protein